MSEWRNIGDILVNFGRITRDDVEQAVIYQKEHGGYFGEALLALELVSQEELEWGLASQYDLPYVFPDADTIDPEAAALVSPEWALAHLALPIMRTETTLTVIVDAPIKTEAVEELQLRTDLKIEIALASAGKIRDLIRQVYAKSAGKEEEGGALSPISLREALADAMDHGARRFGISTRGPKAIVWYRDGGRVLRRTLDSRWKAEMEELVTPSPAERVEGVEKAEWSGYLNQNGIVSPLEVRFLASESGTEYLLRPTRGGAAAEGLFPAPPEGFDAEIRLLARSGSARFIVTTDPPELGRRILPHLPGLLLDAAWRSLHLTDRESELSGDVFSVRLPEERAEIPEVLLDLHPFSFDVVTADITGPVQDWVTPLLNLAATAFVLWSDDEPRQVAREAGIRWEVRIERRGSDELAWDLHTVKG